MNKKPETVRVQAIPMAAKQIEALTSPSVWVELFVSSRLGPESVSHETEREHDVERTVVESVISSFGDRGQ
jgi:hypothetical protein